MTVIDKAQFDESGDVITLWKSLMHDDVFSEKDKSPYTRQQSAPQFRSRGSRFGLGMFSNYMFPGGEAM